MDEGLRTGGLPLRGEREALREAREVFHGGLGKPQDVAQELFMGCIFDQYFAGDKDADAHREGRLVGQRRGRRNAAAEVRLEGVEGVDDPGLALGLGGDHPAVLGQPVEPEQQVLAADHDRGAAPVPPHLGHEVVGLARSEAEEALQGAAVEEGGPGEGGDRGADGGQVGIPGGFGGHRVAPRARPV